MNVYFVAETTDPVTTYYGTRLLPDYTFANAPEADILVIPSGIGSHHSFLTSWYNGADVNGVITGQTTNGQPVAYYGSSTALINWVTTASAAAQIVTSHCWGAFTLADAGVLDGLSVTTFPGYTDTLMENYPAIGSVVNDQRYVVDGKVMTSAGAVAAFEACQAVIKHLFGAEAVDGVMDGLVFSPENRGHVDLEYYRPSPTKEGDDPYTDETVMKVGILLLDGAFISEPAGPFDVFAHMGGRMNVYFVGASMDPIQTYYGATMYPDYTVDDAPAPDVLVVPSGGNSRGSDIENTAVITWLQTSAQSASWITSHCWGAFMLGGAGLLDGKTATTFPGYFEELKCAFPAIGTVVETHRIVRDGNIVTSNGGIAAYEAANYVVEQIYGEYHGKNVATGLVFSADNYAAMADAYVEGTTASSTGAVCSSDSSNGAGANGNGAGANDNTESTIGLPAVDTSSQLNVGILIMPGIFISEATIPFDMYKHVAAPNAMNVYFVAETTDPVTTYYGTRLAPDYTFQMRPRLTFSSYPAASVATTASSRVGTTVRM
jgi:transcriptional regulator GlxA family with amidase domain